MKKKDYRKKVVSGSTLPLKLHHVQSVVSVLKEEERARDLALFCAGLDSMLRASDLVRLLVEEVTDDGGDVVERATVLMKKVREPVDIAFTPETRDAIGAWLARRPHGGPWLFPGRAEDTHITEIRYRQLCKEWFAAAGVPKKRYSTHSIRKTKPSAIYGETKNLKTVSEMLGHKDTKVTERYLGIERAEAISVAASFNLLK